MKGVSVIIVAATSALAACNPVSPIVDRVDGAMYTTPGGGDAGPDAGDAGKSDAGKADAGKDASR